MLEGMTPEMWALARVIIITQLIFWIMTRVADFGINMLTFRLYVKRVVTWRQIKSGKDKGLWVKEVHYEPTERGKRIFTAIIDYAWNGAVSGLQGTMAHNPLIKMFGKKWGERITAAGQFLKHTRPDIYNKALDKMTGVFDKAVE